MKVRLDRFWINQPSALQPHHNLHGTNVLAAEERPGTFVCYFLKGDVLNQEIDPSALSPGWLRDR